MSADVFDAARLAVCVCVRYESHGTLAETEEENEIGGLTNKQREQTATLSRRRQTYI